MLELCLGIYQSHDLFYYLKILKGFSKMNFNLKRCKVVSLTSKPSLLAMLPFVSYHYHHRQYWIIKIYHFFSNKDDTSVFYTNADVKTKTICWPSLYLWFSTKVKVIFREIVSTLTLIILSIFYLLTHLPILSTFYLLNLS